MPNWKKKQFLLFLFFWEMVAFVHKIYHNIAINNYNSMKNLVLLRFCLRLDSKKMKKKFRWKKNVGNFSFFKIGAKDNWEKKFNFFVLLGLHPLAPDVFGLNARSQLVIGYQWLAFLNQVLKNLFQFSKNFEYKIEHFP